MKASYVLLLGAIGCGEGPAEEEGDEFAECVDSTDNDRDGLVDCEDPGCAAADTCVEGDADADADADTDTDTDVGLDLPAEPDWPACSGSLDPAELQGRSYVLDSSTVDLIYSAGTGALLIDKVSTDLAVGLGVPADEVVQATLGEWQDGEQNLCAPTVVIELALDRRCLYLGPVDMSFELDGYAMSVEGVVFLGRVEPGGSAVVDAVGSGWLDVRPLGPVLKLDADAVCELAGSECEPCPSDGAPYCLPQVMHHGVLMQVDASILPVSDPPTEPACEGQSDCEGCAVGPSSGWGGWAALGLLASLRRRRSRE